MLVGTSGRRGSWGKGSTGTRGTGVIYVQFVQCCATLSLQSLPHHTRPAFTVPSVVVTKCTQVNTHSHEKGNVQQQVGTLIYNRHTYEWIAGLLLPTELRHNQWQWLTCLSILEETGLINIQIWAVVGSVPSHSMYNSSGVSPQSQHSTMAILRQNSATEEHLQSVSLKCPQYSEKTKPKQTKWKMFTRKSQKKSTLRLIFRPLFPPQFHTFSNVQEWLID